MNIEWDEYFRNIVHQIKLKSKDESTKVGALIIGKDNELVSSGYNSFPRNIKDDESIRQERPEKYFWFEHAERNAIYNAARIGVSTLNTTMYLTCDIPCADCARGIINAGIIEIVCESSDLPNTPNSEKWYESAKRSLQMFKEAGINVRYYEK